MRTEQEEADAALVIELQYLGHDGERGIIHHDVGRLVFLALIVATGIEGAHEVGTAHVVLACHPFGYGIVHHVGRIAVVGGALGLELLHELLIFGVILVKFAVLHLLLKLAPLALDGFVLGLITHPRHLQLRRVESVVRGVEAVNLAADGLYLGGVPGEVHLRGEVIEQSHAATLGTVERNILASDSHQRVRVGIYYHHSLLARCLEALLRLVATHEPVVLVDEHRAARATFAEAALYQLLTLLGAFVEIVVVLNEVVDADHLDVYFVLFVHCDII